MLPATKLIATQIEIPWGEDLPFKGDLYVGTPSRNKPKDVTNESWQDTILNLAVARGKACIVVPDSFWCKSNESPKDIENCLCIKFPDLCDGNVERGTPQEAIVRIVEHLKDAEDVLILSTSKKISGFIPAILSMLAAPDCHIEKIMWPIEHGAGYTLTPAQRGYLAGLYDASQLHALGLASPLFKPLGSDIHETKMDKRNPGGDATGLLQSMDDERSLNRAENLGAVVRKFVAIVLNAVSDASDGKISRELGIATVQASCDYYAGLLTGRISGDYSVDGAWFPNGLAAHLRTELDVDGDAEEVISSAFASIAHHLFEIVQMDDEEASQNAVDDLVRASMLLLSGVK